LASALALAVAVVTMPGRALGADATPRIFGGSAVSVCAWPTTVRIDGCTGTLVSHELIVLAAHCGADHRFARLGTNNDRVVELSECAVNPDYSKSELGRGIDWAYCKIARPDEVADIPIVPVLADDELDELRVGASATLVGYGTNDQGLTFGTKMEVHAPIVELGVEARIGGGGLDSCQGDSGGPAFLRLADGTWRVFGITSYGGRCGEGGYYTLIHRARSWIEAHAGVALQVNVVSPRPLVLDPGTSYGTWDNGCQGGPSLSPLAQILPGVEVLTPSMGESFLPGTSHINVRARIEPALHPIVEVRLMLDHQILAQLGPSSEVDWDLENLSDGQHYIEIFARDEQGVWGVDSLWIRLHRAALEADEPIASEVDTQKDANLEVAEPSNLSCSLGTPSRSNHWLLAGIFAVAAIWRSRRQAASTRV
jgi:hypothetical protein